MPPVVQSPDGGRLHGLEPQVFAGYWRHRGPSERTSSADRWFRTGDIGQFDDDGYLRLVGRSSDLIISGGYNVYPREVEDILMAHPAVTDAAVKGVASEDWGEAVTAWVAADGELTAEDVLTFARRHLAPHKCPKVVHVVDAIPRNAVGKILRHELG